MLRNAVQMRYLMAISIQTDKPIALYSALVLVAALAFVGILLILGPLVGHVIARAVGFFSIAMIGYRPASDFSKAQGRRLSFIVWFFVWAAVCAGVGTAESIAARAVGLS
jgi:uncharacterized membrane protein